MVIESIAWIALFMGILLYAVLYAVPVTRPYARSFWWMAVIAVSATVSVIVFRKTPGRTDGVDDQTDRAMRDAKLNAIDRIVDFAAEQVVLADSDLARNRLHSADEIKTFDAKLDAISKVDDSLERRRALIALVGGVR